MIPAPRGDERVYSYFHGLSLEELVMLADWVFEVEQEASECFSFSQDKNSINHGIISPFLKALRPRTSAFQSRNVQSCSFHPALLPQLSSQKIDKKIDNALCLRLDDRSMPFAKLMAASGLQLGLMTEAHMQKLPILVGLEIKQSRGGYDEAKLQIFVFMTAYMQKLEELSKDCRTLLNLPAIAFIVHGKNWDLYVGFRKDKDLFVEQVNDLHISVSTAADILMLRDLFRRILFYFQDVYLPVYLNAVRFPSRGEAVPHSHRK